MVSVDVEAEGERKFVTLCLRGQWRDSVCKVSVGAIVAVTVSSMSIAVL